MDVVDAIWGLWSPYISWFFYAVLIVGAIGILLTVVFAKRK